jgi:hypothetical protein
VLEWFVIITELAWSVIRAGKANQDGWVDSNKVDYKFARALDVSKEAVSPGDC